MFTDGCLDAQRYWPLIVYAAPNDILISLDETQSLVSASKQIPSIEQSGDGTTIAFLAMAVISHDKPEMSPFSERTGLRAETLHQEMIKGPLGGLLVRRKIKDCTSTRV